MSVPAHPSTPPPSRPEDALIPRTAAYGAQLRALGADPDALDELTDATTEDVVAWLEGRAPCPVDL